MLLLVL